MPRAEASTLNLDGRAWGLQNARREAEKVCSRPMLLRELMRALCSADGRKRQYAADTARRISEGHAELLLAHCDLILDVFSDSGGDNWRTRAHLGLIAARVSRTPAQRRRAAGLLMPLYYDASNVVRCTAIEGLGLLAQQDPVLRQRIEPMMEEALASGTKAMQTRARAALRNHPARA